MKQFLHLQPKPVATSARWLVRHGRLVLVIEVTFAQMLPPLRFTELCP